MSAGYLYHLIEVEGGGDYANGRLIKIGKQVSTVIACPSSCGLNSASFYSHSEQQTSVSQFKFCLVAVKVEFILWSSLFPWRGITNESILCTFKLSALLKVVCYKLPSTLKCRF